MRRLFEGCVTNAETLAAGGDYSRAATIRGRRLIDEIHKGLGASKINDEDIIKSDNNDFFTKSKLSDHHIVINGLVLAVLE